MEQNEPREARRAPRFRPSPSQPREATILGNSRFEASNSATTVLLPSAGPGHGTVGANNSLTGQPTGSDQKGTETKPKESYENQ
jgi:hypothetical protein